MRLDGLDDGYKFDSKLRCELKKEQQVRNRHDVCWLRHFLRHVRLYELICFIENSGRAKCQEVGEAEGVVDHLKRGKLSFVSSVHACLETKEIK